VLPFLKKAKSHHVPYEPAREEPGPEVIVHLARAAHQVLFLRDPAPLAGQQIQPDIVRIPLERLLRSIQHAQLVVVNGRGGHTPQDLRRGRQPIPETDGVLGNESKKIHEERPRLSHLNAVVHRALGPLLEEPHPVVIGVGRGEAGRPALEVVWELAGKNLSDRRVVAFDEQLYPRAPVMVRRALGVEAQDLRAWTDQPGRMMDAPEFGVQDGSHGLRIEVSAQLAAGLEHIANLRSMDWVPSRHHEALSTKRDHALVRDWYRSDVAGKVPQTS